MGRECVGHQVGAARKVSRHRRRSAVPRRVQGDDLVAPAQLLARRTPGASGLGEAVDQSQPRPATGHLHMQHAPMLP
jgi:hypothetical protein